LAPAEAIVLEAVNISFQVQLDWVFGTVQQPFPLDLSGVLIKAIDLIVTWSKDELHPKPFANS
jgi:hypothetical protein